MFKIIANTPEVKIAWGEEATMTPPVIHAEPLQFQIITEQPKILHEPSRSAPPCCCFVENVLKKLESIY
ncbi:MAG: hypothetical protein EXS67_05160 [Candidatus Margulisbacteria bacterium]|nr:hypothetical protein [Candidatus Margulisiibacteriota bacterium]